MSIGSIILHGIAPNTMDHLNRNKPEISPQKPSSRESKVEHKTVKELNSPLLDTIKALIEETRNTNSNLEYINSSLISQNKILESISSNDDSNARTSMIENLLKTLVTSIATMGLIYQLTNVYDKKQSSNKEFEKYLHDSKYKISYENSSNKEEWKNSREGLEARSVFEKISSTNEMKFHDSVTYQADEINFNISDITEIEADNIEIEGESGNSNEIPDEIPDTPNIDTKPHENIPDSSDTTKSPSSTNSTNISDVLSSPNSVSPSSSAPKSTNATKPFETSSDSISPLLSKGAKTGNSLMEAEKFASTPVSDNKPSENSNTPSIPDASPPASPSVQPPASPSVQPLASLPNQSTTQVKSPPISSMSSSKKPDQSNAAMYAEKMVGKRVSIPAEREELYAAMKEVGIDINPLTVPWCAAGGAAAMIRAGLTVPKHPEYVPNWLQWGHHIDFKDVKPGDAILVNELNNKTHKMEPGHFAIATGTTIPGDPATGRKPQIVGIGSNAANQNEDEEMKNSGQKMPPDRTQLGMVRPETFDEGSIADIRRSDEVDTNATSEPSDTSKKWVEKYKDELYKTDIAMGVRAPDGHVITPLDKMPPSIPDEPIAKTLVNTQPTVQVSSSNKSRIHQEHNISNKKDKDKHRIYNDDYSSTKLLKYLIGSHI